MVRPLLPDVEALTVDALKANATLSGFVANRISTELPTTFPDGKRVKLHRAGGSPVDGGTERLDRPVLEIETFGPTKAEAFDTAAQTIRALQGMAGQLFARGVVGLVETLSGPTWSPEPETFTPRYLISVALHVHAP